MFAGPFPESSTPKLKHPVGGKMRCVFCGGKVVAKNVTFIYEQGEQLLVIRDVPAEVCTKCGERTYSPAITDDIMKFAKRRFKPVKLVEVPVFDYGHKIAMA